MAVWMEDWRKDGFKICLKESKIFDGVHKNIEVVSIVTLVVCFKPIVNQVILVPQFSVTYNARILVCK